MRRVFHLERVPQIVHARAVCDGRYVLWVNGARAASGPVRSQPGILAWDEFDISGSLRQGANCIAVLARHYGTPNPWWVATAPFAELGRGGFALECLQVSEISTADHWRVRRGPWLAHPGLLFGPPNEELDASALPQDWVQPGFDDREWEPAVVLSGAPGDHVPATIPGMPFQLVERNPLPAQARNPVVGRPIMRGSMVGDLGPHRRSWASTDPGWARHGRFEMRLDGGPLPSAVPTGQAVVLDLGGVHIGHPTVTVRAPAGALVTMRAAERLDHGMPADEDRRWLHRYRCRGGEDHVEAFERVGLRYLQVSGDAPMTLVTAGCVEERYPLTIDAAFACNDPALEKTWQMGVRTLEVCSTDAFVDCPSREQRAWVGDSYLTSRLTCAVSSDTRLVERNLRLAARTLRPDGLLAMVAAGDFSVDQETIPDASLLWLLGLHKVHRWTGNDELLQRHLGTARTILDWFWAQVRDGVLAPLPGWVFLDWVPLRRDVPSATIQGLLVLALDAHQAMCAHVGDHGNQHLSQERAASLRRGFARFVRGGQILETPEDGVATQHALAAAILAGVGGSDQSAHLRAAVAPDRVSYPQRDQDCPRGWALPEGFDVSRSVLATQPFFAHFLHAAMSAAQALDLLLPSIRRWEGFHGTGDGTFWEVWPEGADSWSHAHAWSATPTLDLLTRVLGVTPASPGFASVRVAPYLGTLSRAAGQVPTPHGIIALDLERRGRRVNGEVTLPDGVTGTLELPGQEQRSLRPGRNDV